jgi:signal transduction histidine kinase
MEGQERVKRLLVRGVSSNGTVTVDIEDTGPGIPDDARALLFDRFYTTKPLGKGTGLGLWISREIVAEHGGTIEAVRGEHGGACFRLRFPLREWEHRREEAPIALPSALPVPA